jgi:hypothetical protein
LQGVRYFGGDFDAALTAIRELAPIAELANLGRDIQSERIRSEIAWNIYSMEGKAMEAARHDATHNLLYEFNYPPSLFCLGEYSRALATSCRTNFFSLEVLANMGLANLTTVDTYLADLYDTDHLQRMQVSYLRAKLAPLGREAVEPLVIVNPYTRGLKNLMLAFVEPDRARAAELHEEAIEHLRHIKYYQVEAMYLYAAFLRGHGQEKFDTIHGQGFSLAKRHYYRFLQYRFEQLLNPTGETYDPRNYPLPDGDDFSDYIQFLTRENKKRQDRKSTQR